MNIIVTDLDNSVHEIPFNSDDILMHVLRNANMGIVAECDGNCVCATCHIYVETEWLSKLADIEEDEEGMLDKACAPNDNSRLSCQIELSDVHDAMKLTVGPKWE